MTSLQRAIAPIATVTLLTTTLPPPLVYANPAAVAAPAACAIPGVGWVGCAVLGTVIVAGTLYYVVQLSSGDRLELPQNQVRRSGGVRPGIPNGNGYPQGTTRTAPRAYPGNVRGIDDPDQPITSTMIDYVWGNSAQEAMRNCQQLARQHGMSVDQVKRNSRHSRRWQCWAWSNHPDSTLIPDRRNE